MSNNESIFISMPTMNDNEYIDTLYRLFDNASNPDKIFIGTSIFWSKKDFTKTGAPFLYKFSKEIEKNFKNVKFDILPWMQYPGVGHGRTQSIKHYNNETYYLSLDPHTVCVKNWDEKLINLYKDSKKIFGSKRIITTYLPSYIPESSPEYLQPQTIIQDKTNIDLINKSNVKFIKDDYLSRWQCFEYNSHVSREEKIANDSIYPVPWDFKINNNSKILKNLISDTYLPAKKISAHFLFTEGEDWVKKEKINLDPNIYFWLEEFYQSTLAYSRGYNFIWIKDPLFFHYYTNSDLDVDNKNYKFNKSPRKVIDDEDFISLDEKNIFYKKYLDIDIPIASEIKIDKQNKIIENLMHKKNYFGYLPRSPQSFLKYSGVDMDLRRTSPWWEVPEINVVYK